MLVEGADDKAAADPSLLRVVARAHDITTAIVDGRQPRHLSAKKLMGNASRLPADWAEQRTLLGF